MASKVQQAQPWYDIFLKPMKEQMILRKLFAPARNAQFNQKLRKEDQPNIKGAIFFSYFGMFNLSLLLFYFLHKTPKSQRVLVGPPLILMYAWFGYKWQIWWLNHQVIRKLELNQNQTSYYFRRRLLTEFSELQAVKSRRSILTKMNEEYQQLYN